MYDMITLLCCRRGDVDFAVVSHYLTSVNVVAAETNGRITILT